MLFPIDTKAQRERPFSIFYLRQTNGNVIYCIRKNRSMLTDISRLNKKI